ncbi:hypothetical protein Srubr_27920 [Streptomyces rubradiris]|uniref:IstB-like ATP-binding domain-containing protein n=1 Tax=Streptomyces rubradiris TaxID=285531 RepID=A0ABQ3RAR6_STRRR|nr:hypothetical protein GCM10018792_50800 [Streptomyces rubradiris]GHI52946.1 hypothetical protein Srubr_27920 [Streptomyces rubradiris]
MPPCSGRPVQVFGDEVLATAILDRLLHHCEVISNNGLGYRLKNRLKAIERENDVARQPTSLPAAEHLISR